MTPTKQKTRTLGTVRVIGDTLDIHYPGRKQGIVEGIKRFGASKRYGVWIRDRSNISRVHRAALKEFWKKYGPHFYLDEKSSSPSQVSGWGPITARDALKRIYFLDPETEFAEAPYIPKKTKKKPTTLLVEEVEPGRLFLVHSSSGSTYEVSCCGSGDADPDYVSIWECNCPSYKTCKHITAVSDYVDREYW